MGNVLLENILENVRGTLDGAAALRLILELAQWHRVPASAEYSKSVHWAAHLLQGWGVETQIHSHPTDGTLMHWGYVTPPRWECRQAWLEWISPSGCKRLADYEAEPISVIQRSIPTGGVIEAELVAVKGSPDSCGKELQGKIMMTDWSPEVALEYGVRRQGALGMIIDRMDAYPSVRPRGDLAEALQWNLFPYTRGKSPEGWGFVVSPSVGKTLRQECERGGVWLRALVETETGAGFLEGVSGFIPGEEPAEIWLVAHLCHPAPFANDNASGAAVLLECARTITELVRSGQTPPLRRGIRFLLPVEISGTIAYLAANPELQARAVAGLNLDMVGPDQAASGSVLCIDRPPDACPSCLPELLERIYTLGAGYCSGLSGNSHYPLFRWTTTSFSAGSDHWVLSDPSVGIPTPMLIEWPDRHYHTTADTIQHIDSKALKRNGTAAASYALFLACAGDAEIDWLERQAVGRFIAALGDLYTGKSPPDRTRALRYRVERQKECLQWLDTLRTAPRSERLFNPDGDEPASEEVLERTAQLLGAAFHLDNAPAPVDAPGEVKDAWNLKVRCVYPGPISHFAHLGTLPAEEQERYHRLCEEHPWAARNYYRRITHWANGSRTFGEIASLLELDLGRRDDLFLAAYLRLLERLGLVELFS